MKNKKKQFNQNGFIINEFKDKKILLDIRKTIKKHFTQNDKFYCMMDIKKFHAIAYKCQKEINSLNIQERFHLSEKNKLSVKTSSSNFNLLCIPPENFPSFFMMAYSNFCFSILDLPPE